MHDTTCIHGIEGAKLDYRLCVMCLAYVDQRQPRKHPRNCQCKTCVALGSTPAEGDDYPF